MAQASSEKIDGKKVNEIIKGLAGNDELKGNDGNDVLIGGTGNDVLKGENDNDILIGVDPLSTIAGRGEYDTLTGGKGVDRFVLGDTKLVYYNDGNNTNKGLSDYAAILDFDVKEGDVIQLKGTASDYILTVGTVPNTKDSGTLIQSTLFGDARVDWFCPESYWSEPQ